MPLIMVFMVILEPLTNRLMRQSDVSHLLNASYQVSERTWKSPEQGGLTVEGLIFLILLGIFKANSSSEIFSGGCKSDFL